MTDQSPVSAGHKQAEGNMAVKLSGDSSNSPHTALSDDDYLRGTAAARVERDRENTRICAIAMGYTLLPHRDVHGLIAVIEPDAESDDDWFCYDPHTQDAYAMALVKRRRLYISPYGAAWRVEPRDPSGACIDFDLNHAIVACFAKMESIAAKARGRCSVEPEAKDK